MNDYIYVAWADPAMGRVIGVYSEQDKAEAATFRYSKTPRHHEGETLTVLRFRLNNDGEVDSDPIDS